MREPATGSVQLGKRVRVCALRGGAATMEHGDTAWFKVENLPVRIAATVKDKPNKIHDSILRSNLGSRGDEHYIQGGVSSVALEMRDCHKVHDDNGLLQLTCGGL